MELATGTTKPTTPIVVLPRIPMILVDQNRNETVKYNLLKYPESHPIGIQWNKTHRNHNLWPVNGPPSSPTARQRHAASVHPGGGPSVQRCGGACRWLSRSCWNFRIIHLKGTWTLHQMSHSHFYACIIYLSNKCNILYVVCLAYQVHLIYVYIYI